MKPSGVGGQAVLEGVMMKNGSRYAVAVRKPDKQIVVEKKEYHSAAEKHPFLGWPIIRGVVNFVESMVLGMKTLTFSASFFEEEETTEPSALEKKLQKMLGERAESILMGGTVLLSVVLAIGIFMLLPFWISSLLGKLVTSNTVLTLIEGLIRITIFIGYVLIISLMKDIRRVFMYHGAEHKSINCIENGLPLTVANVKKQSTRHKRCGTSFMLFVILISAIFFMFIRVDNMWLRMLFRILLIPVIAGVSYEFIRLAGKSENAVVGLLSKPGLWLQGLTTREPDKEMIEVAIQSVEAVFDWKEFLKQENTSEKKKVEAVKEKTPEQKKTAVKEELSAKSETAATSEKILEESAAESIMAAVKQEKEAEEVETVEQRAERLKKKAASAVHSKAEETGIARVGKAKKAAEEKKAAEPIEHMATGLSEDDEDDDILNALDRFFAYKKEETDEDK